MGNPRQRRKQKSSDNKLSASRQSQKRTLRKAPRLSAPSAILSAWDKKLTVHQNYAKLGLASNLDLHSTGGFLIKPSPSTSAATSTSLTPSHTTPSQDIPKGRARIVRDSSGKVVDVIFSAQDQEVQEQESKSHPRETAWGVLDNSVHIPNVPLGFAFQSSARGGQEEEENATVRQLEELASSVKAVKRHSSSLERTWLAEMVRLHGSDTQRMARDLKINVWQKTAGQIAAMIRKAGGVDKLAGGEADVDM